MAFSASAKRLYSINRSPTSDTLSSSSEHSKNRLCGGLIRIATGDATRDESASGLSILLVVAGTGKSDERLEAAGDPCGMKVRQ